MGLLDFRKRIFARWEAIGRWSNGEWNLQKASQGLIDALDNIERRNPRVWIDAARTDREIIIRGEHFDYRTTPSPHEELGLRLERKPK